MEFLKFKIVLPSDRNWFGPKFKTQKGIVRNHRTIPSKLCSSEPVLQLTPLLDSTTLNC